MLSFLALLLLWQSQPLKPSGAGGAAPQTWPVVDVPTPENPKERLDLAVKTNGLVGLGVPWHLRATYKSFGPDGQVADSGAYEEWWVSSQQYRVALRNATTAREEFATDHGFFVLSQGALDRRPLRPIQLLIEKPVYLPKDLGKYRLENYQGKSDRGNTVSCTALIEPGTADSPQASMSYCFAPVNSAVLYACSRGKTAQSSFGPLGVAQEQNFGRDVQVFLLGQPWLKVHIEILEGIAPSEMGALRVPAGAQLVNEGPNSPDLVTPVDVIKSSAPDYPPDAQWHGVQGDVVVSVTIGTDGLAHATEGSSRIGSAVGLQTFRVRG